MAAVSLSLCSSLTPKIAPNQSTTLILYSHSKSNLSFLSHNLSSLSLNARKPPTFLSFVPKSTGAEADSAAVIDTEIEDSVLESDTAVEIAKPKPEEVFAVVMVGGRQYIVFPGRFIHTHRLKDANVNDKITLNKVLLVGTKTSTYIGYPIVPNTVVHAVVEEQKLDKKVIVFKYKKKKNYRRNIGHRQPITRIRITSIDGYQDTPAVTLP